MVKTTRRLTKLREPSLKHFVQTMSIHRPLVQVELDMKARAADFWHDIEYQLGEESQQMLEQFRKQRYDLESLFMFQHEMMTLWSALITMGREIDYQENFYWLQAGMDLNLLGIDIGELV